jgi:hypothetical protein
VTQTDGKAPKPAQLRRRYGVEKDYLPLLVRMGHSKLRHGFIAVGVSSATTGGLIFFLEDQITLNRHQEGHTRAAYRKILEGLNIDEVIAAADNFAADPPIMHTFRAAA